MKKITLFVVLMLAVSATAELQHGIVYVKPGATGTGASWSDAMGNIQAAITLAKANNTARKDVWVAGGEYVIATCISMSDSINVYGSFAGTETELSQRARVAGGRAWEFVTPTVLNGGNASRLFQVTANPDIPTTIDGFTLTNGNGVGSASSGSAGGALIRHNLILQNSIVQNCTISGSGGGIMFNGGGTVRYCLIKNNTQTTNANGGGGIYLGLNSSGGFNGFVENSVITGNTTTIRGGGIATNGVSATATVSGCEVYNNKAIDGVTLKPGAGIHVNQAPGVVKNCVIYNNTGANALYYNGGNNIFNNTVVKNIGGIYVASAATIINNLVWGCATDATGNSPTSISGAVNSATVAQNNATYYPIPVDKSWTTADNIVFSSNWSNGDVTDPPAGTVGSGPKLNHVTRYYGASSTPEELLQLDSVDWCIPIASPCLNTGKTIAGNNTDILGLARPQGYPAETALFDIGAYELPYFKVVAGEPATANGAIYSALGVLLTENFSWGYAKGEKIELFFQPNNGYTIERAYYKNSTDGGVTFTGNETDITAQISTDGFWTGTVYSSFRVSVVWKGPTALTPLIQHKIKCLVSSGGVELEGLTSGDKVSVYQASGRLISQSVVSNNRISISLSQGVYILRVADSAEKIVIR